MHVKAKVLIEIAIEGDVDGATGACEGWWLSIPDDVLGAMRGTIRDCKNDGAIEPTLSVLLMDLDKEFDGLCREAIEIQGDTAREQVHVGEGYESA